MDKRAFAQNRLSIMQDWHVGALEEFSDGDFIAPEQRLLHRSRPITPVVSGFFLQLFHARTVPLVGVVMVVRDAGAEDVQKGEASMFDTLLDQLSEMLLLAAVTPGDEGGPSGQG